MRRPPKAARSALFVSLAFGLLAAARPAHAVPPGNGKLQIIHLNAAQGNAAVLISPEGEVAMFDDGSSTNACTHCPSCGSVLSQLQSLGVTHVKLHFASHYHEDHIGCISQLIPSNGITLDQGWDRGGSYSSGPFSNYLNFLNAGARRHTLTKGKVFMLDSLSAHPVTIKCIALAGDGISTSDENSKSVVMRVTYGEFDEVIGGDLVGLANPGVDVETQVGPQVGRVEVALVHHHGSFFSTNEAWLTATQAKIGIVTAGTGNSFGHPTSETMTRLHNHGVRTYWSELGGGASPNPAFDKVANGMIRIVATWQLGGVDSIYATAIADTFTNASASADQVKPIVDVLFPDGLEVIPAGSAQNVTWTASDNVGVVYVNVDYSLDDGSIWNSIAAGIPNSGSYPWSVPDIATDLAVVRVTAFDAASNWREGVSHFDFTIADQTAPIVTIVSPNGGESLPPGTSKSVTWTASDNVAVASVDLDYSLHGAPGPWLVVQHGLANSGSYIWTVPASSSDSMLVRLTGFDAALNQATDTSDNLFQVRTATGVPIGPALGFALAQPDPNPTAGRVVFRFSLAAAAPTQLDVLDVTGRRVWGTQQNWLDAGRHDIHWDGRDDRGGPALSGLYFVRLTSGGKSLASRFVRLK